MKQTQPQGLNRRQLNQLLSKARHSASAAGRMDVLSRDFLGRPYRQGPLIGSADSAEVFTASLDGFDCVTYIETVLALARASDVDDFIKWLRQIRYQQGCIRWERRNHYMTSWIRHNLRQGMIRPVSIPRVPIVSRQRVLNAVPGLAARPARVNCVPKPAAKRLVEPHLQSGDLIFFVSTRRNLDVFHAGIIVRGNEKILMRHASRSHGMVVEQELDDFLTENRMAGIIVERPQNATRPGGLATG
jgi:cell wall-associated NlpC family hydrolase